MQFISQSHLIYSEITSPKKKLFSKRFYYFFWQIYMKSFLFKETFFQRHTYSKFIPVTTEEHKEIVIFL